MDYQIDQFIQIHLCFSWSNGDNWHRFIPIPELCDVNLVRRLLNEKTLDQSSIEDQYNTILPNTTQKKFCLLVCIEEHNHPPLSLHHVLEAIQTRLKTLIENASNNLEHVASSSLVDTKTTLGPRIARIYDEELHCPSTYGYGTTATRAENCVLGTPDDAILPKMEVAPRVEEK
ncbi:hypothetical protein C2G38_2213928 [Gigaspora rosea]|uniref:Uncharacterized protein n=1 Tax=Gigaspora rosea TaxID=44941 RepID=A0A397UFQ8_9GLOM|nr:hypothetical protein C2G38_2213928 [Gigaspora rosea]